MTTPAGMKLVFRLGGIGFSLPIEGLVEIRDDAVPTLDRSKADPAAQLLGHLSHRGAPIPVRSLGARLGLDVPVCEGAVVLVLPGEAGTWGVAADSVEGIFPATEFLSRRLPPLLTGRRPLPCSHCDLWRDEPLLSCEAGALERWWEGA